MLVHQRVTVLTNTSSSNPSLEEPRHRQLGPGALEGRGARRHHGRGAPGRSRDDRDDDARGFLQAPWGGHGWDTQIQKNKWGTNDAEYIYIYI